MIKQTIIYKDRAINSSNIFVGDRIASVRIPNMSLDFSDKELKYELTEAYVSRRDVRIRKGYFSINNMHFDKDTPILAKRSKYWEWRLPESIEKDDVLFGNIFVRTNDFIDELCQTFELTVDMYDTYFMNGILVHNRI